jgi:ribosomal protein S18 acetylase RimI-like enzyme
MEITKRPIRDDDTPLLYRIYAASRTDEMALTDWTPAQIDAFLHMQFDLQHSQYMTMYRNPTFDIVLCKDQPAGRLYVERTGKEIRVIDIAMLPEFRGRGIGTALLRELIAESESCGTPLTLHVEHYNPAQALYRRLGFEFREDRGVYIFMERPAGKAAAGSSG